MRKPSKRSTIVAGAATAGLIAVGTTIAVAQGSDSTGTDPNGTGTGAPNTQSASTTVITAEQAKRIALREVPGGRIVDVDFDTADPGDEDASDRVDRWEVDLVRGSVSYDVDIDAQSGSVLKNRSETDDDGDDRGNDSADRSDDRGHDDDYGYDDHGRHVEPGDDHGGDRHGGDDDGDDSGHGGHSGRH